MTTDVYQSKTLTWSITSVYISTGPNTVLVMVKKGKSPHPSLYNELKTRTRPNTYIYNMHIKYFFYTIPEIQFLREDYCAQSWIHMPGPILKWSANYVALH